MIHRRLPDYRMRYQHRSYARYAALEKKRKRYARFCTALVQIMGHANVNNLDAKIVYRFYLQKLVHTLCVSIPDECSKFHTVPS